MYTEGAWTEEVHDLTGGRGVDVVLDSVGATWADSLRCLRRGGRLVVFGGTGGSTAELDVRGVYLNWLSILGTTMGSAREFEALLQMLDEGRWRPAIDSVRPLVDVEAAHDRIQSGEHFGKLVLSIG